MTKGRKSERPRRALEGGTLLPDFLGDNSFLPRVARAERAIRTVQVSMLPAGAAADSYVRRFGSMVFAGWGRENVAANVSASELARFGLSWQAALVLPFAGAVQALMVGVNSARTGGSLTVEVFIGGSGTGLQAVIDAGSPLASGEFAPGGSLTFEAGEPITLVLTSSSWGPTSADLTAMIEVAAENG